MPDAFTITTTRGSIDLNQQRQGSADFSVTNVSGQPVRARALPVADAPAQPAWFAVADGAERNFPVGGTEQYVVQVTAPATAAPGSYRFRLDVLGTDNPDEVQAHGEWVSFQLAPQPKPPPPRIPWLWIIIAAAALVVVASVAVTVWVLTHRQGTISPSVSTLNFGTVAANSPASLTVTVKNTGPAATTVTATIPGPASPFSVDDGCGRAGKLQPNATCTVAVRFAPTTLGSAVAVLMLSADNASAVSVSLIGTGAVTLFPASSAPAQECGPSCTTFSYELGLRFYSDVDGYVTAIRYYKGSQNTGAHHGNLWTSSGQQLGTVTFTSESPSGWQQANFSQPVRISANQTYVVSFNSPRDYVYTDGVVSSSNPPLHAVTAVYGITPGAFPTTTYPRNYWADIVFTSASPR